MIVNILGTDYFLEEKTASEEPFLEDGDGFCDFTSKRIVVRKYTDSERRMNSNDIPEVARQAVIQHELTHAFLYESGMECFDDEIIVEWVARVARLFPKLFCAFVDAGAATIALDGAAVVTGGLNVGQVNNLPDKSQNSKQDEFWRASDDPIFIACLCDYIKTACKLHNGEAPIADPALTELIRQELLCFAGVLEGDYKGIHAGWSWMHAFQNLAKRSYNSKRASSAIKSVLKQMKPLDGLKLTDEDVATALKIMSNDPEKPEEFDIQDPAPNLDPLNELAATVSMAMCQLESAKVLVHSCEWDSTVIAHDIECALVHASDTTHFLKYKIDKEVSKHD